MKNFPNVKSRSLPGELRQAYFQQRREYKKLIKNKRQSFLDTEKIKLWSLNSESPKLFWKKLSKGRKKTDLDFDDIELFDYFSGLHSFFFYKNI